MYEQLYFQKVDVVLLGVHPPSVCEARRSISFSFMPALVLHCTDTHIYVFPLALALSVVHNKKSGTTLNAKP